MRSLGDTSGRASKAPQHTNIRREQERGDHQAVAVLGLIDQVPTRSPPGPFHGRVQPPVQGGPGHPDHGGDLHQGGAVGDHPLRLTGLRRGEYRGPPPSRPRARAAVNPAFVRS